MRHPARIVWWGRLGTALSGAFHCATVRRVGSAGVTNASGMQAILGADRETDSPD